MLRFAVAALLISFGLAAGGAAGALTEEEDLDLGEPIWDRDDD